MITRSITAAAQRFTRKLATKNTKTGNNSWQEEAWDLYSVVPEIKFMAGWIGNAAGAARLYAGRRTEDGTIEAAPDNHPATHIVSDIAGGPDGQAQLLKEAAVHLAIAGEYWTVITTDYDDTARWHALSTSEVTHGRNGLTAEVLGEKVNVPAADDDRLVAADAPVAIRVWEPHPRRHIEADSPVRSSLVVLEELRLLNAAVAAAARSRITGRGVLMVPKGTRFPTAPGQGDAEDDLLEVFMEVASTAIREPDSAAATVPIMLEIPADLVGKVEWLTFESGFDELAMKLRDEAIRRFATASEIPAEIMLGLGDVNHWSSWLLQGEAIRMGVEPKLRTICNAYTQHWLQPLLEADGVADAGEWLVWYDTSQMRVQANRAQTALEAFQLRLISAEAARREVGFSEDDRPDADNQEAPEQEAGATPALPAGESTSPPGTHPEGAENEEAAMTTIIANDALIAAVDGIVYNALSAAGMRILTKPACPRSERGRAREITTAAVYQEFPVDAEQVDAWRLLDGAWARVPEVAARYGVDAECLTDALDGYVRGLIAARVPFAFDDVPRLLRMAPCTQGGVV